MLTGVSSRLSSSVADAAASMRSSQRFPYPVKDDGSADMALRSELGRRWWSRDLVLSCLGFLEFAAMDDFLGLLGLTTRPWGMAFDL
jgi:hypothetical protein